MKHWIFTVTSHKGDGYSVTPEDIYNTRMGDRFSIKKRPISGTYKRETRSSSTWGSLKRHSRGRQYSRRPPSSRMKVRRIS
jgi:hypothetical protein